MDLVGWININTTWDGYDCVLCGKPVPKGNVVVKYIEDDAIFAHKSCIVAK